MALSSPVFSCIVIKSKHTNIKIHAGILKPNIEQHKVVLYVCLNISTENSVMLLKITNTHKKKNAPNLLNNTLVHNWAHTLVHLIYFPLHMFYNSSGKVFLNAHHPHKSLKNLYCPAPGQVFPISVQLQLLPPFLLPVIFQTIVLSLCSNFSILILCSFPVDCCQNSFLKDRKKQVSKVLQTGWIPIPFSVTHDIRSDCLR